MSAPRKARDDASIAAGSDSLGTPTFVDERAGLTRFETGEIRLLLEVRATGLTNSHRELLLELVRQTAGSTGTAWASNAPRDERFTVGANTYTPSPTGVLVSLLERAQRHNLLPPLTYRTYSDDVRADLQDVVMATPGLGAFRGKCDSRGRVHVADDDLRVALAADDPSASVALLAGLPWNMELGKVES